MPAGSGSFPSPSFMEGNTFYFTLVYGGFADSVQIESGHNTRRIESGDSSRNQKSENTAFYARAKLNLDTVREVGTSENTAFHARGIGLSPFALVSGM